MPVMPSKKAEPYIREDFELEKTHLLVDAENDTTVHSKLALVWVRYIKVTSSRFGTNDGVELHIAYQAPGQEDTIEGMVSPEDFERLGEAAGDAKKEYALKFLPFAEALSSEPSFQTIIIPLLGPYGFQKLVHRFAFMLEALVSDKLDREAGDYVTRIDLGESKKDQRRLLS